MLTLTSKIIAEIDCFKVYVHSKVKTKKKCWILSQILTKVQQNPNAWTLRWNEAGHFFFLKKNAKG